MQIFKRKNLLLLFCLIFFNKLIIEISAETLDSEQKLTKDTVQNTQNEKLAFVFELVRHGARAPLIPEPEGYFLVGPGMLTPIGMRQRYLIGRYNRQRYIDEQNGEFIKSIGFQPGEIEMYSTNVHRAIQSSYAEMLGIYPPQADSSVENQFLTDRERNSLLTGKSLPKIKLSYNHQRLLNIKLQNQTKEVIDFPLIPLFNFLQASINDDVTETGCPYAGSQYNGAYFNPIYYQLDQAEILPILKQPYINAYLYCIKIMINYFYEQQFNIIIILQCF